MNDRVIVGLSGASGAALAVDVIRSLHAAGMKVQLVVALMLKNAGHPVDYALMWDQPHSEADVPGGVREWIDGICNPS